MLWQYWSCETGCLGVGKCLLLLGGLALSLFWGISNKDRLERCTRTRSRIKAPSRRDQSANEGDRKGYKW